MKMHFDTKTSPSHEQRLTKMRSLTRRRIWDNNGLFYKWKRDRVEKQILSMDADPSPLPPAILPARGFGMTRGCKSMGSGAGRHQILFFPQNILPPGPASILRQTLVILNRVRYGLQGRSGEGSTCSGREQSRKKNPQNLSPLFEILRL